MKQRSVRYISKKEEGVEFHALEELLELTSLRP